LGTPFLNSILESFTKYLTDFQYRKKFNHFPSLTLYCLKPQSIFQALRPKAVGELRKEIAIDVSNTAWRTFAKLGGE
jgi:hypothetical protein